MSRGKEICKELKAVRRRIAEENGIPLEMPECTHKGPCRGTCPRCEAEVSYLESELEKRVRMGKVATVAGLAMTLAACGSGVSNPAVDTADDSIEGEAVFELMDDDTIPPPPPPEVPYSLQLSGINEYEGFVIDTPNQPREMLEHLSNAAEPLPEDVYDNNGTASCNPLDEPVVRQGESGSVSRVYGVVRRRPVVLTPKTPQENRAEAEREDALRALPPVVHYDEVDGVKVINNDEQR